MTANRPHLAPRIHWLLAGPLWISLSVNAADDWKLQRSHPDLKIYSQTAPSGYLEIRASTRMVTTLSAFVALLQDTNHIPDWLDSVSQVTVLEEPGQNIDLVHTLFRTPWPVADRDMVTWSEFFQPTPCSLILEVSDRYASLPEQPGYIRMRDVHTNWTLETGSDGYTTINYRAYANPSGKLPKWIANRVTLKTIESTLLAVRQELSNDHYQTENIEGVVNCPIEN